MNHDDSFKIVFVIVIVVVVALAFSSSGNRNKYEDLQEKYDLLEENFYDLEDTYSVAINKCEDPLAVLYCYFEDEGITFDEARDAFNIIDDQISQFY